MNPPAPQTPAALFEQNRFPQASASLRKEIKAKPGDAGLRALLLRTLLRLDEWGKAVTEGQEATKLFPDDADLLGLLSLAYMRAGRPEKAVEVARDAKERKPLGYWGLVALGRCSLWEGRFDDAQRYLDQAIRLRPGYPEAYFYRFTFQTDQRLCDAFNRIPHEGYPFGLLSKTPSATPAEAESYFALVETDKRSAPGLIPRTYEEQHRVFSAPFDITNQGIYISVLIDGKPFRLGFDTGAGFGIVLFKEAAERLGAKALEKSLVHGYGGTEEGGECLAKGAEIGEASFTNIPVLLLDSAPLDAGGKQDGLFGGFLLKDYVVRFDFRNNRLTAYKDISALALPTDPGFLGIPQTLPFALVGTDIALPITVEGTPMWGYLDSGNQSSVLLSLATAERIAAKLDPAMYTRSVTSTKQGVGSRAKPTRGMKILRPVQCTVQRLLPEDAGTFPADSAFPMTLGVPVSGSSNVDYANRAANFEFGANLGSGFLRLADYFTIDYPNRTIYMEMKMVVDRPVSNP